MIGSRICLSSIARSSLAIALAFAAGVAQSQTTSIVSGLATRPGVTVPLLVIDNTCAAGDTTCVGPVATLILFTGGNGQLHLLDPNGGWQGASDLSTVRLGPTQNFLVRQRNNFAGPDATSDSAEPNLRYNVIMMDVPSDHTSGYPLNDANDSSFRRTANHQTDIADVIAYARTTFKDAGGDALPVWLIGTSFGTTSAAKGALISTQQPTLDAPDGLILTSSITKDGDANSLLEMQLKDIDVSTMLVADSLDACPDSPPPGLYKIAGRLINSLDIRGKIVVNDVAAVGDGTASENCQGDGYHGFSNAEGKAVDPIRAWISGHAASQ